MIVSRQIIRKLGRVMPAASDRNLNLTTCRAYTMRRAMLYVPGNDLKKLRKALSLKVDCIAMDCEDGVAANKKAEARETIRSLLDSETVSKSSPEWSVRVNSMDSGLCEEDLKAVLTAKSLPPTILLPKVENTEQLINFSEHVWLHLNKRPENERGPINLIMFIESARSILDLPLLCKQAEDLSTMAPIIPVALVFGSDDLLADIGATRTKDATEILYARQRLLLIAKAFKLQAIDMVNIHFKDLEQLKIEAEAGAKMGYTGKQVIHPDQVPVVQKAFVPNDALVDWAKGLVDAFEEHQSKGQGAFTYRGSMIDMPLLRQAQNILQVTKDCVD